MTWSRLDRRDRAAAPSRTFGVFLVCVVVLTAAARAQIPGRSASKFYPDSSEAAESLLRNAANHARSSQWSESVAIYQRIIDQFGDKVARLPRDLVAPVGEAAPNANAARRDDDFTLYVDLRAYCQRTLAGLPPEALAAYRTRRDPQAERWYREGKERRDASLLRRVVDEAFCTSWGDDALELLGDLAFQDGRFGEAVAMYRRLVPDDPASPLNFVHPDPSVDLVRVEAKKILAHAALAGAPAVADEVATYAKRRGEVAGTLAGRKGLLAESLAAAVASDSLAPPAQSDARWPTFGGSPTRDKVLAEAVDVGSMQWRAPLDRITPARGGYPGPRGMGQGASFPPDRLLGYHPIVLGDQVVVCDGSKVLAYNLSDRPDASAEDAAATVQPAWTYDAEGGDAGLQAKQPFWTAPRYTLTAVGRRIYARMGPSAPSFPNIPRMAMRDGGGGAGSCILALDRDRPGDKKLWMRRSSELSLPDRPGDQGSRTVAFEGAPVADARNVYVAVTDRREQTATYVASYDAVDGSLRWIRYLGAAASENDAFMGMMGVGTGDPGSRLLSLDGPALYYQTNLGAVVSLDAETGSILWVATYPRHETGRGAAASERDLNPAVVHDGTVFVAPGDASAIFAFDAQTGRLRWKTESIPEDVKIAHLLGVAQGRLVATGDRVLLFDVRDGRLLHAWPDAGGREGFGRGLLAGGRIYWPTRTEIHILDQTTATLVAPPIRLAETYRTTGGNLVAGDGYLIVAQNDGLTVFCQNSRLIERYREEIARRPDFGPAHYRLARAAEAAGGADLALASYEAAARHARPAETVDGAPLIEAARDHEFRLLLRVAADLRRDKKPDEALTRLESATKVAREPLDRLKARLTLAEAYLDLARPAEAVDVFQQLLGDDRLGALTVASDDGRRGVRADLFVGDRLAAVVRERGRASYAEYDRRARELYEKGRLNRDARLLAEAARAFPAAEVVPDALIALGQALEAEARPAEAATVYKRLLALSSPDDEARARALWRLARAYEAQGFLVPARDAYLRLQARFPGVRIEAEPGAKEADAAELASAELAREPLARIAADRARPSSPSPLVRRWLWRGGDGADSSRPVTAVGVPPAVDSGRTFLASATALAALDPAGGEGRWTADLGARAAWVGYLADKLVAATPARVLGLDARTGAVRWRFGPEAEPGARPGLDPFARDAAPRPDAPAAGEPLAAPLHGFQAVGGRLFVLRGDDELLALDGDTGLVDWSFSARGGGINPLVWIGPERLVIQTGKPLEIVVLETETGRGVSRRPLAEGESLQRAAVPLDDEHAIVVTDRRTVKKLDLTRGQFDWDYRESAELPVNGPPRPIVDAERLLVIHDGRTLVRLDPVGGLRRWSALLGVDDLGERPDASAMDERRFFWSSEQQLRALSLEDGTTLWSRPLAGPKLVRWSIALSDRAVVAYPESSGMAEDATESLPVVVRRQADGALVQRFMLPAPIEDVALRLDPRGAVVATPHALWALGDRPAAGFAP
ncbi:outer membrane protein assembly factor BamB family protein [Paludisphaera mucosa]|uniref:PQQ-binding-like beta-propeller repeat protein n=1 Tax=Paludisphaera mucosa TaxID=3030827 RepID=A0ABT6FD95_9BACT|nr:PQQ-binding-like beta-propeller repeat protein [Paludisphaera mucosa]MDG3005540.1 PQQ-binding-like beta-propeller repeat protein [Paludisphaera mucosa]